MLAQIFHNPTLLNAAQAGVTIVIALAVMLTARGQHIHIERDTIIALARGIAQIVAVGLILVVLLKGPVWVSFFVLVGMILAAASISTRRVKIPGAYTISLTGIALGAGSVIVVMTLLGVIEMKITSLVPVGSMVIANAMNTNALTLERFRSEIAAHTGQIETGLSLGADPKSVVAPYVQASITAGLIPSLNSLSSLGIVWIPGLMAGMILSNTNPVNAAIYQFVVIAMLYATGGLTSMVTTLLIRSHAFSAADQLVLR